MDLFRLIINANKTNDVCSLCFKEFVTNSISLHDVIEIHDELFNFNSTIDSILKCLFPKHDMALTHICEDCSSLLIKIFILLQKSTLKNYLLHYLVDNVIEKIEEMEFKLLREYREKKCMLKVDLPSSIREMDTPIRKIPLVVTETPSICNISSIKKKDVRCTDCDMIFESQLLLKTHTNMMHKNTNHSNVCDICGKLFNKNSKLITHLDCHKLKECPYCFNAQKSHSHCKRHLKFHTVKRKRKPKYYECNNCQYRSVNKATLNAHMNKLHLQIQPFTCDICQRGFYKKYNLVQHLYTHNKTKDKTCHICGETFGFEKTLLHHLMLHSGQKPYKCELCNIGFITSGRRLEHIQRKHREKKENCATCGKMFGLKKDLKAHVKKVHGF